MAAPKNARRTSTGRLYDWRAPGLPMDQEPERFWSVTTIIKAGLPSPALTAWGMKAVAEFAVANHRVLSGMLDGVRLSKGPDGTAVVKDPDAVQGAIDWLKGAPYRERDRKANVGSALHALAEAHVLGRPTPDPDPSIAGHAASFRAFLDEWRPTFEMTEATVYSRSESYAGTLDAIAVIPGLGRVLLDYKTSGSGVYPEAALQLAMYRHAEFVGLPDGSEAPMPQVDGCVVVWVRADGYDVIPVIADEQVFRSALYVREVMRWAEETSKGVIGQPMPLPKPESVAA